MSDKNELGPLTNWHLAVMQDCLIGSMRFSGGSSIWTFTKEQRLAVLNDILAHLKNQPINLNEPND